VFYHRADGSVQLWTREEVAPGRVGALIASADGALAYHMPAVAHRMPVSGSVAVGSLGSGVYVGEFNPILGFPIMWLLGGVSIGIAQWLVLRRRITRAGEWLPATILGRVVAGISTSIVLGLMRNLVTSLEVPLMVSIAGMGVYSAVPGVVTGMVLVWGTRRSPALKEGTP
jgi:hypothetical protein